ncbi:zinc finger protein Xfin-like isoform X5 [Maniola jurtina]|uniref:zinc finger protein Xfin-like isoform X5 n=1 Tax=Maniola jurtina TaxID=191418 RepID=UPI001E6861CC|nr:zinc finger protein Xfin-like isoform X5 [Maniola jurtina]
MQCCVPFCLTTPETVSESARITFHKFPSEDCLRDAWLRAIGKQDSHLPDSAVVCSQHFLNDDLCTTESGSRQIRPGAIPSMVQVCMICLDTRSKLLLMSKYNLDEAYQHLVGQPLCDQGNLKGTLCIQCAQRLVNFNKFRDKSLRARALMMELVEKHELISMQHMDIFNEVNNQLKHNIVKTVLDPDHCNLYINSDTDKQPDVTASVESVTIKNEANVPMSVDEDSPQNVAVRHDTEKGFNINLVVTKEEYLSDEEPKQLSDPLFVKPSTSKDPVEEPLAPVKYEITFECSICMEEFADEDTYNYHMSMHMEENQNLTEEPSAEFGHSSSVAPLNASSVKKNVLSASECILGILPLTHHQETFAPVAKKVSQKSKSNETNPDDKTFTCHICNAQYKHKLSLHRHIRIHTGSYPYSCKFCDYKCMIKSSLTTHVRIHTGEKPFTCETCKFRFARKCDLVKHMKIHTNEKPYTCKICEFRFRLKSGLMEHIKTHSGTKPYSCKLCEYKSTRNSDLVRHMKSHTGEKPFACELCDYKCIRKCNLTYHMTTHTRDKPFTCEICELKFSLKTNLRRHITVTHTGNKL